jgi:hypothetical protein
MMRWTQYLSRSGSVTAGSGAKSKPSGPRRPDVDPGQIADGVVELGVGEPPRQDGAGVARIPAGFAVANRPDPLDDGLPLVRCRLAPGFLGRHLVRLQPLQHDVPDTVILDDRRDGRVDAQVQLGLRLLRAVARQAVVLQERAHDFVQAAFQRRLIGLARGRRDGDGSDEQDKAGYQRSPRHQSRLRVR